eukprot:TRINITY_DN182_c0_g1_i4.p1 TRINITY_DN182_c0_g1~~TRINITY_DN182_c0_g1_i4.p1  ORF type:complete len:238 (-),score=50.00 TRINITY_DN182_c0_g1_i4:199-912(-)
MPSQHVTMIRRNETENLLRTNVFTAKIQKAKPFSVDRQRPSRWTITLKKSKAPQFRSSFPPMGMVSSIIDVERLTNSLHYVNDAIEFVSDSVEETVVTGLSNVAKVTLMKSPIPFFRLVWRMCYDLESKGLIGNYDRALCIVKKESMNEEIMDEFSENVWFLEEDKVEDVLRSNPLLKDFRIVFVQSSFSGSEMFRDLVNVRSDLKVIAPFVSQEQKAHMTDLFSGLRVGEFSDEVF